MKNKMMILLTIFLNATVVLHAMDEWNAFKKTDENNNTPLHFYVAKGDLGKVRLLLEQGFDVNATDKNGVTPLHWASFNNHVDIIKILVNKGANINAKEIKDWNPLAYAYQGYCGEKKKMELLKLLISLGADPNTVLNSSGWTPLFYAVDANDMAFVSMLLEKKANVHAQDCCENVPLRYAVLNSTLSMIRLLIKGGADINARDGMGQTPLFDACRKGDYNKAKELIELGADVNFKGISSDIGTRALTEIPCCWAKKPEVLIPNFCISDGACVDNADHGLTPLHIACFNGHEKIVSLLIEHGANVHSAGIKDGTTPLHMAAHQGHSSIVKKLLNAGAKIDSATIKSRTSAPKSLSFDKMYWIGDGITPLFSAIGTGRLDIVKILAPMTNVNKKAGFLNITSLHYACQLGHFDILKELIKNKVDHTLLLGNKFSAIEVALCHGHNKIAQFLNDLKVNALKAIKSNIQVIRPSETMTIIRSSHHNGCSEFVVFKTCTEKNCLLPGEGGVYYHTPEGIKPVPTALRKQMVANHLLDLNYDQCKKMGNVADIKHHFDPIVEKTCGDWAWVVIDNNARKPDSIKDEKKRFDLYITLPGSIYNENNNGRIVGRHHKEEPGVFEFKVRKSLYEKNGECYHHFYAPKGIVGADAFGAKSRQKIEKKPALS